jgi:ribosomal protein S18 acetylase RimI-like enzyme
MIKYTTEAYGARYPIQIEAIDGKTKTQAGLLVAEPERTGLTVTFVKVKPAYQRRGIATRMYEIAGRYACANKMKLASDITRSDEADAFWRKQIAKGRARRVKAKRGDSYYVLSCPVETLSRRRKTRR